MHIGAPLWVLSAERLGRALVDGDLSAFERRQNTESVNGRLFERCVSMNRADT